ncbi:MAG: GNAT family N-acetyltransferase [Sphingomonas sp.]|nr:GNAT family N-acetyltransferase [Sphingomonas sp.]
MAALLNVRFHPLRTLAAAGTTARMHFAIRIATATDIAAMHRLRKSARENRLSDFTRITEATYLPYIAAASAWVAETDAGISGFAVVDGPAANVWALFIDPDCEGAGIGRALHRKMLEWAREQGIGCLSLSTEHGSRAARFYSRAGWAQTDTTADGEVLFEKSLLS